MNIPSVTKELLLVRPGFPVRKNELQRGAASHKLTTEELVSRTSPRFVVCKDRGKATGKDPPQESLLQADVSPSTRPKTSTAAAGRSVC
jgi:hypothetical protein